jgi:hypothetical protein
VSILSIGIGAATPVNVVNLSMHSSFLLIRASSDHCVGVGGSDWFLGQTPIAVPERCSLAEDCVAVQSIKLRFVGQRRPNS